MMRSLRIFASPFLFFSWVFLAQAEDLPSFQVHLNKATGETIQIGDRLRLRLPDLNVQAAQYSEIRLELKETNASLKKWGWILELGQKSQDQFEFIAVPLRGGDLTLPELLVKDSAGNILGQTLLFVVKVEGLPEGAQPPSDHQPPVSLSFPTVFLLLTLAGFLFFSFIVFGAFYLWIERERKINAEPARPTPPRDAAAEALKALLRIEKAGARDPVQLKKATFEISEILKTYLGARYSFASQDLTTDELLLEMNRMNVPSEEIESTKRLYEKMDWIKFADRRPESEHLQEFLAEARACIARTKRGASHAIR